MFTRLDPTIINTYYTYLSPVTIEAHVLLFFSSVLLPSRSNHNQRCMPLQQRSPLESRPSAGPQAPASSPSQHLPRERQLGGPLASARRPVARAAAQASSPTSGPASELRGERPLAERRCGQLPRLVPVSSFSPRFFNVSAKSFVKILKIF
jgi:hypothetical protein